MNDLEKAEKLLTEAGYKVERPLFTDPAEIAYRNLLAIIYCADQGPTHPTDDPRTDQYEWQEYDELGFQHFKKHYWRPS